MFDNVEFENFDFNHTIQDDDVNETQVQKYIDNNCNFEIYNKYDATQYVLTIKTSESTNKKNKKENKWHETSVELALNDDKLNECWITDSGATRHMTRNAK